MKNTSFIKLILFSGFIINAETAAAAIHNVDITNSSEASPYQIDSSYASVNNRIISSEGTVDTKSYVNIGSGISFDNITFGGIEPTTQNLHGSVVYAYNSVIKFAGNNVFSNNKFNSPRNTYGVIYAASPYRIGEYGKTPDNYTNDITFGNNTLFENNSAVMGNVIVAEASENGKNTFTFGDDTFFKNNKTTVNQVGNGGNGGVIMSEESSNIFNFGNNTVFEGNQGLRGGVILADL